MIERTDILLVVLKWTATPLIHSDRYCPRDTDTYYVHLISKSRAKNNYQKFDNKLRLGSFFWPIDIILFSNDFSSSFLPFSIKFVSVKKQQTLAIILLTGITNEPTTC